MSRPDSDSTDRTVRGEDTAPEGGWMPFVYVFVTLFILWLLWSGPYTVDFHALFAGHGEGEHAEGGHPPVNWMILILGLVSCAGVTLLCRQMKIVDKETFPLHLTPRILRYLPWLIWQIVLANFEVIRRIVLPRASDVPETVVFEAGQESDLGRASHANSITLTPGTVTVDVDGRTFTVHALTPVTAGGVRDGEMDRRVRRLEGSDWGIKGGRH